MRVYRRSATVTSRGNRSRRFSQREQVSVCPIKLCIILVKQPACAHFGDDWKSGLIERRLSFRRIRIRRAGSFASSVCAPSARLHARIRARSDDACVTILHFRAVIDGVHTSRRALDLDASSGRSFIHSFFHSRRAPCRPRTRLYPKTRDSTSRVPEPR